MKYLRDRFTILDFSIQGFGLQMNSLVKFWHGQSAVVTCYIAGVDVEWPLIKVIIITVTFLLRSPIEK